MMVRGSQPCVLSLVASSDAWKLYGYELTGSTCGRRHE